ncbi:helix-turn-helix domain-containing protein [Chitinophaga pollutisoli]|uniref:Helix-turn-helix domain-containing protein n=1 Tax=Chitinophaga pollutisoli TaxID=3133966 RepID=A0ABZ2YQL0_9BACT
MDIYGKKYEIDERLKSVLQPLYAIKSPECSATEVFHLSPNLEMLLIFSFGTPVRYTFENKGEPERMMDKIMILGPLRRMLTYERAGGTDILVLPFVLDGFYRLLGISPDGIDPGSPDDPRFAQTAGLLAAMHDRLAGYTDPMERAAAAESFVLRAVAPPEAASVPLLQGRDALHDPNLNPVKVIAGQWDITERAVQQRFRKYGGYSPKELIRFLRFKEVVNWLLAHPDEKPDWFFLIEKFGYHDQSHLIKDFKLYTGAPPREFLRMNDNGSFCTSWQAEGD